MKKILLILLAVTAFASCNKAAAEKPNNLIPEEQMVDILYDMAILEAIRTQKPLVLESYQVKPTEYIYKKYKIDSVQFAKSNLYYASDLEKYKKLYDKVADRLDKTKAKLNEELSKNGGIVPTPEGGQIQ